MSRGFLYFSPACLFFTLFSFLSTRFPDAWSFRRFPFTHHSVSAPDDCVCPTFLISFLLQPAQTLCSLPPRRFPFLQFPYTRNYFLGANPSCPPQRDCFFFPPFLFQTCVRSYQSMGLKGVDHPFVPGSSHFPAYRPPPPHNLVFFPSNLASPWTPSNLL